LNPIVVRQTPNAKGGNYTLVAGAHPLRAVEMIGHDKIDVMIVKADRHDAVILEVAENLFRNELSVIDRSLFVQTYRELWEERHGEIKRGGDQKSKRQLVALIEDSSFSQHIADRIGLSKRSIEHLDRISQNLNPELRHVLRGTAVADNQSRLLRLARLEPLKQRQMVVVRRR